MTNCTCTAAVWFSGRVGMLRFIPFPLAPIFAFPSTPDCRLRAVTPSDAPSLSLYLNPFFVAFQHGFPLQVPPAGTARFMISVPVPS